MTRFLLAGALAAATVLPAAAPAQAVPTCDNVPVFANCWTWSTFPPKHCDVWVAPRCIVLSDLVHS